MPAETYPREEYRKLRADFDAAMVKFASDLKILADERDAANARASSANARASAAAVAVGYFDKLVAERDALRVEVETLRLFGHKDCTAQADAELARRHANR